MDNTVSRFEQSCPECEGGEFVDDFASGDLICKVDSANGPSFALSRVSCAAAMRFGSGVAHH